MNQESGLPVCSKADGGDKSLEIIEKQQIVCSVVSPEANNVDYRFAEEVALRHPSLSLMTITSDERRYSRNATRRTIGGHIISQKEATRIVRVIHYARTSLRSGINVFVISNKLIWSVTYYSDFTSHKVPYRP